MTISLVLSRQEYLKWHTTGVIDAPTQDLADAALMVGDIGDGKVAFPFLAAAALGYVGSGFLGSAYSAGRSYLASRENSCYWSDYQRNTGVTPRYKYRSGYYYDYGRMFGGVQGMSGYGGSLYTQFDRW